MIDGSSHADLDAQGRSIVERLGGKWRDGSGMCRCPAHDDVSPSLSVRTGDTSLLFHCFAGCNTLDVLRALRRDGQCPTGPLVTTSKAAATPSGDRAALVERLWRTGRSIRGTIAEAYLAGRGIVSHSAQLRFHPRVQLGPTAEATYHPALLAAVRADDGVVAVHRTFLDPATRSKASFENPKRLLGVPGRGTVRLGNVGRTLGLAEGIETALAAAAIHGIPVWAVLGNERFGLVDVPAHLEEIVILADNDAGGTRAVALAEAGLGRDGRTLRVMWPPARHNDWADVLAAWRGEKAGLG